MYDDNSEYEDRNNNRQLISGMDNKLLKKIGKYATGLIFFAIMVSRILYTIDKGHVGIVFAKFGSQPKNTSRFIVEEGEKGVRRKVLMPGVHVFWMFEPLWKYNITEVKMISVPKHSIGLVEALDGKPMNPGQILADSDKIVNEKFVMGQKGPRLKVLKPGKYPINTRYLKVKVVSSLIIKQGQVGIVTQKIGNQPPKGTVLVEAGSGFKGIQKDIWQPGEYYVNPMEKSLEVADAILIHPGQVGIVTKKIGELPPSGTILVGAEDTYRGIQRKTLQPGMYYFNPYEKKVEIVNAIRIKDGHVGVKIAKTGKDKAVDSLFAEPGQRGILRKTMSPGLYYINEYEYDVVIVDVRQQKYEMTFIKNQGDTSSSDSIKFLSDDGFEIEIDLTVLYQIVPNDAPYMVATVGRDVQAVCTKIIRPTARSYGRILGSKNKGEEFVHGKTREEYQNKLRASLTKKCLESRVKINQALVRHFEVPKKLRSPITKKVIARKLMEQYEQEQKTQEANAELARNKQLVVQKRKKVEAETTKITDTIQAEKERAVEEILMAKKKFEAQGDAEKVRINAKAEWDAAEFKAKGIKAVKFAEADGQRKLVDAWGGSQFIVANNMAKILQGVNIFPLETLLGGSGNGKGGNDIQYANKVDLLNFFKLDKMTRTVKKNK